MPRSLWKSIVVVTLYGLGVDARADAVTDWNEIMEVTVATDDPYLRLRTAAITQLAVFEAVNSILGDYEPYLGSIAAPPGASPEAAAISAAHRALKLLHPERAAELDASRASSLSAILDGAAKNDGITVGEAAADAMIALRSRDGSDGEVPYEPGARPGQWRPTPPAFIPAFRPGLGKIAPFAIEYGAQFRLDPPPRVRSGRYARDYNEVKRVGDVNSTSRPQDRTDVAIFYGITEPVPIYNPAARQVSQAQGKTLAENARIFALLAMAIADAAVAVFDTKYHYNYWRPVTAIRAGGDDGNKRTLADPDWLPLIETPPFPSYPSGHAGFGGAARRVLEKLFGPDGHSITLTNPELPDIVLHYRSFKQITDDIDEARIFGGVHYRFDQESGARQGKRLGNYILKHQLRPLRDRD
jgi:hypothetical protein